MEEQNIRLCNQVVDHTRVFQWSVAAPLSQLMSDPDCKHPVRGLQEGIHLFLSLTPGRLPVVSATSAHGMQVSNVNGDCRRIMYFMLGP